MEYARALEFTRYNSGKHFLDSGLDNGRHWQQPAPPEGEPVTIPDGSECPYDVALSLTQLLADVYDEDTYTTEAFEEWSAGSEGYAGSWFGDVDEFLTGRGYVQRARDNVYNGENDLDQVFIYEVWTHEEFGYDGEWLYSHYSDGDVNEYGAIVVIYAHTGADVRGGYSKPLFVTSLGDYRVPFDLCVEWHLEPVRDDDEGEVGELADQVNDEVCAGYASNPTSHMVDTLGAKPLCRIPGEDCYAVLYEGRIFYARPGRPYMGE